jgi:hypothetical protein
VNGARRSQASKETIMGNDARRMEDMRNTTIGPASIVSAPADDAAADPLASAIGYEAADPALLARLWADIPDLATGDRL